MAGEFNPAKWVAYALEHGTSPEAEAARVLRRFMCCPAGREMVEHALLRPFGYTLEPGRVVSDNRYLRDMLERFATEVAEAEGRDKDLANLSERMRLVTAEGAE